MRAADQGKQVIVLVEIKARFDEEANIVWARKLEQAGAHVVYGLVGLKTHSKVALVVRREGTGLRRYVHLGTGNYNPKTARLYTDLGLLTCRPELGADATDLFNYLTGLSRRRAAGAFSSPRSRSGPGSATSSAARRHARAGRPARIVAKVNALVDPEMIEALYEASQAGVNRLIVRGICGLRPGPPRDLERIRVRSIIGQFLEHSRIFGFDNGGRQEGYTGSADRMERNLDRRVEVVFPIEDLRRPGADRGDRCRHARRRPPLVAAGRRRRLAAHRGDPRGAGLPDTFAILKERALATAVRALEPAAAPPPTGSLDPRA